MQKVEVHDLFLALTSALVYSGSISLISLAGRSNGLSQYHLLSPWRRSLSAPTQNYLRPFDDAGDAHAATPADGNHPVP
jgi:hypothetical protein